MLSLKKGSQVKVISGKDKGKTGEILEINRSSNRVKIKAINMIKKHLKPTKENKGGIITKENFIHISNVRNVDKQVPKTKTKKVSKK
jgi:large subunit ribosomal protein L24